MLPKTNSANASHRSTCKQVAEFGAGFTARCWAIRRRTRLWRDKTTTTRQAGLNVIDDVEDFVFEYRGGFTVASWRGRKSVGWGC